MCMQLSIIMMYFGNFVVPVTCISSDFYNYHLFRTYIIYLMVFVLKVTLCTKPVGRFVRSFRLSTTLRIKYVDHKIHTWTTNRMYQ